MALANEDLTAPSVVPRVDRSGMRVRTELNDSSGWKIMTTISGVEFSICYSRRVTAEIDGISVNLIGLEDRKINKQASGRNKDLNDLEPLP